MPENATSQVPSRHFLDFVLNHAQVKTNVCSCQKFETGYTLLPRTVPDYNLIFMRRGTVVWVVDDVPYTLEPGDLILVPPAVKHHGYSKTKKITLGSLHVEVTLPGGQDVFDVTLLPPHRHVDAGTRLDGYLRDTVAEYERDDKSQTALTMPSWARLVVLELIRYDAEKGTLRQRPVDPLVAAVLEDLNQRIAEPTTLDWLSERSGFTPQHLNRVFRKLVGVTPLQYLNRMRMERAATLLADGRLTIKAIARELSFDDPYYFSRQFKQHFGRSPLQYRDALQA